MILLSDRYLNESMYKLHISWKCFINNRMSCQTKLILSILIFVVQSFSHFSLSTFFFYNKLSFSTATTNRSNNTLCESMYDNASWISKIMQNKTWCDCKIVSNSNVIWNDWKSKLINSIFCSMINHIVFDFATIFRRNYIIFWNSRYFVLFDFT